MFQKLVTRINQILESLHILFTSHHPREVYMQIGILRGIAFGFMMPAYGIFLKSNGLSYRQINDVNSVYMALSALLEIPTGLVGDLISHKFSVTLGLSIWTSAMFVYAMGHDFTSFIIAEAIAAVGASLISGSLQAWLKNMTQYDRHDLQTVETNAALGGEMFRLLIIVVSGVLLGIAIYLPWLMSGVFSLFASYICFTRMNSEVENVQQPFWPRLRCTLIKTRVITIGAIRFLLGNKEVALLLFGVCIINFVAQPLNMFWGPYYAEKLGTTSVLGIIGFGISIGLMSGMFLLRKLRATRLKDISAGTKLMLASTIILVSLSLGLASNNVTISVVMFCVHEVGRGMINGSFIPEINSRILNDEQRATTLSVITMWLAFASLGGLQFSGYLSTFKSVEEIWSFSLILVVCAFVVFLFAFIAHKMKG